MDIDCFRSLYVAEIKELRSAEFQLTAALPELAQTARSRHVHDELLRHALETETQCRQLDELLARHGISDGHHHDSSMDALIGEARRWSRLVTNPILHDACLISSIQRIEHYEIAVYGSLATWARYLGYDRDKTLLLTILTQERRADDLLSTLANEVANPKAAFS